MNMNVFDVTTSYNSMEPAALTKKHDVCGVIGGLALRRSIQGLKCKRERGTSDKEAQSASAFDICLSPT
ncbi:jg16911 [Pararge aegeria aegeria]|uniref:Jg16911 protein n=1 Tax=Pararge aegeria aegeria TaxID=348720 RepID=A0A8S4SPM4_9NEOP|nr:jg16911 [Pararge aegeria aegeria]